MRRAHRPGCRHCAMVREFRAAVDAERDAAGGWRNENFRPSVTFADWLVLWNRERRALSFVEHQH
ncbi:MAG: hypothetical protein JWO67_3835 [Streptosporangiaceae bacterium]|nr:hypothetical protein [Streptosporangiaceae bacterium]